MWHLLRQYVGRLLGGALARLAGWPAVAGAEAVAAHREMTRFNQYEAQILAIRSIMHEAREVQEDIDNLLVAHPEVAVAERTLQARPDRVVQLLAQLPERFRRGLTAPELKTLLLEEGRCPSHLCADLTPRGDTVYDSAIPVALLGPELNEYLQAAAQVNYRVQLRLRVLKLLSAPDTHRVLVRSRDSYPPAWPLGNR